VFFTLATALSTDQISKSLVRARLEQGHQFVSQAVVARARLDEWRMSLPGTFRPFRRRSMSHETSNVMRGHHIFLRKPEGFRDEPGLSRRTRAIDDLLYEIDRGFWRWVTGGRGDILSVGVVVIGSARPPPKRLLGLGQPKSRPFLIGPDSQAFIEYHLVHFGFPLSSRQVAHES